MSNAVEQERIRPAGPGHDAIPRAWLLAGIAALAFLALPFVPAFTDPPSYFQFADQRKILGIPHFMDVVSNAAFAAAGIAGLVLLRGRKRPLPPDETWEERAYAVYFAGLVLVAFGSAYFHLVPSPETLLWDRLPMTVAFMSLLAIAVGDRIHPRAVRLLLAPLLAAGMASVLYWRYTESAGRGDLRFYLLVQFFPVLALAVLTCFPGRYSRRYDLAVIVGFYAAAKLFEASDRTLFHVTGFVSGHTLKHLAAACGAAWVLRMARFRRVALAADSQQYLTS